MKFDNDYQPSQCTYEFQNVFLFYFSFITIASFAL